MSRFTALMYHNLCATPTTKYDMTPGVLRDHLRWLRDAGYTMDSMAGLLSRLAQSTVPEEVAPESVEVRRVAVPRLVPAGW